jgi:membrane-associated phospholipid phosphatase
MADMLLRAALLLSLLAPWVDLDTGIQHVVQDHRSAALEAPMRWASGVGRPPIVLGGLLALAIFGGPAGVETARFAILALIPTNLIVEVTKRAVHRTRPDGEANGSNASFPSSHAANSFALAWALRRRWPKGWLLFFSFATFVAFSRIYLNRHFFSDVLCGAIIGLASAWLVDALLARAQRTSGKGAESLASP